MNSKGRPAKIKRSEVGSRIASAREAIGMTQIELAMALKVSQQTVAFWEREAPAPKSDILPDMAKVLNISIDYLLTGEDNDKKRPGPKTKIEKSFSEVSSLPKQKQEKILDVVDALVMQGKSG